MPLMLRSCLTALCATVLFAVAPAVAQVPTAAATPSVPADSIREVRLRDGSILYGRIVEETPERVVIVTTSGTRVEVARTQIESMRFTSGRAVDGAFWVADPNSTRLFFTSTARPLRKGDGYISSFYLFFPLVAYGVTDRFTIAAGTPILPGLIGRLWYVAPKYTVRQTDRAAYAVGALGFFLPQDIDDGSVGIVYGSGTWGSRDRAVTAGAGWGYFWESGNSQLSENPVVMIGGETRVSRRVKLITENWFSTSSGNGGFVSGGVRFIGDRLSADLGMGGFAGTDGGCCLPLVNFVYNFGKQ